MGELTSTCTAPPLLRRRRRRRRGSVERGGFYGGNAAFVRRKGGDVRPGAQRSLGGAAAAVLRRGAYTMFTFISLDLKAYAAINVVASVVVMRL
jgi:hypothetical protein